MRPPRLPPPAGLRYNPRRAGRHPRPMIRLAALLDGLNERVGRAVAWLALALALVQITVVVLRYVFGAGSIWLQEGVIYLHAALFMLAAGYTAVHDGHVRV